MALRAANKLLYRPRAIGIGGSSCANRLSPLMANHAKRSHSMFWQRLGIDVARAKIRLFPLSRLEAGGRYMFWVIFEWYFVGM